MVVFKCPERLTNFHSYVRKRKIENAVPEKQLMSCATALRKAIWPSAKSKDEIRVFAASLALFPNPRKLPFFLQ